MSIDNRYHHDELVGNRGGFGGRALRVFDNAIQNASYEGAGDDGTTTRQDVIDAIRSEAGRIGLSPGEVDQMINEVEGMTNGD